MNATSRAILQTVLSTDPSLSPVEQNAVRDLIEGRTEAKGDHVAFDSEHLLISQKRAATLLDVSRVTIWRMTKESILHPVEVIRGTWRYPCDEILAIARQGAGTGAVASDDRQRSAA